MAEGGSQFGDLPRLLLQRGTVADQGWAVEVKTGVGDEVGKAVLVGSGDGV